MSSLFASHSISNRSPSIDTVSERSLFEMGMKVFDDSKWDDKIQPNKTEVLVLIERMLKSGKKANITVGVGMH